MKTTRTTDNGRALRALIRILKYKFVEGPSLVARVAGVRDSYLLTDPAGNKRRIKIQKRGRQETTADPQRCWYGVAFRDFEKVDDFVFWAEDESILYLVPTTFLQEIFDTYPEKRSLNERKTQWHGHIHFGKHEIHPARYPRSICLLYPVNFAKDISEAGSFV